MSRPYVDSVVWAHDCRRLRLFEKYYFSFSFFSFVNGGRHRKERCT